MFENKTKKFLPIVSMFLMLCLFAQMLPLPVLGATMPEEAIQEPVIKNEVKYFDVTTFAGNSDSGLGDKITANGAKYDLKLDGDIVGSLVFNKNSPHIEIVITSNVTVNVLWNCASKYASCALNGAGIYKIPHLVQDNGKTQNFNAIWITDVKQIDGEIGSYQNISVHDAKQLIDNTQNIVLLDVRNQSEYDLGHLYDAQLIPLYSLENRTLPMELEPPPVDDTFMFSVYQAMLNSFHLSAHVNDPIIVYCKAGSRSASACELLVEQGYTQVYNVVGGITEWMKTDYPTFTPRHHVDVAVVDGETIIDIEPWLLYTADCIPCQDLLENEPTATTPVNITDTIIQQSGNSTLTHSTLEIDGTILELLTENTVVWQQNETSPDFNRTMSLSSRISSTPEGKTLQAFELYVQVQHNDYLITISTFLQVLDDLTYNQSTTYMEYLPAGAKPFTTVEVVEFTTAVSLSGLFKSLAETVDALGYGYEVSEDDSLQVFAERYYTLADEVQLLSHTVETELSSYDKLILFNMAVIEDGWGDVCDILCPLAILVGCVAACYFSGGALCTFCILFNYELGIGCTLLCAAITIAEDPSVFNPTPRWVNSIRTSSWSGNLGRVWNDYYLCGSYGDGYLAQIYAGDPFNQAVIVGVMNAPASGNIRLYGYSYPGYYTDYQIWVSNDGINWGNSPVYAGWIYDSTTTSREIYGGYSGSSFRYISIVCYNTGFSCNLFVDCVSTSY